MRLSPTPHVQVGDVVAGRLRIVREIARGGMGALFEAEDVARRERVAVKVVLGELALDAALRERLVREARAASKLASAHVTRILEVGQREGGEPYVVMELLEGETVDAVLAREGLLDVDRALDWTIQALEAIAEAHAAGLVHRDLKPGNLFVAKTSTGAIVKVLDFGLVRDVRDDVRLTQTGESLGTPAYMAPEQVLGSKDVEARADVWAIGVSLYEMLTGRLPFEATTIPALFNLVTTGTPVPIATWRPSLGEPLASAVMRCLERDPARRFPDARALRDVLVHARATRVETPAKPRVAPRRPPRERRRAKRDMRLVAVGAAGTTLVLGLLAIGLFVLYRRQVDAPNAALPAAPADAAVLVAPAATESSEPVPSSSAARPEPATTRRGHGRCSCTVKAFGGAFRLCRRRFAPFECRSSTRRVVLCPIPFVHDICKTPTVATGAEGAPCSGYDRSGEQDDSGELHAVGPCAYDYDQAPGSSCLGFHEHESTRRQGVVVCEP